MFPRDLDGALQQSGTSDSIAELGDATVALSM